MDGHDEDKHQETYRIRVSGHIDDRWADWLGGLAIQRQADGTTLLAGPLVDQAALHGVLACIRDLGLPLLAVDRETGSPGRPSRDPPSASAVQPKGGSH
jgi:hypothetical protein